MHQSSRTNVRKSINWNAGFVLRGKPEGVVPVTFTTIGPKMLVKSSSKAMPCNNAFIRPISRDVCEVAPSHASLSIVMVPQKRVDLFVPRPRFVVASNRHNKFFNIEHTIVTSRQGL